MNLKKLLCTASALMLPSLAMASVVTNEPLAKLPHAIYCATQHSPSESDLCRARGLDSRAAKLMAWFSSFEANHCLHSSNARGRERERRRSFS